MEPAFSLSGSFGELDKELIGLNDLEEAISGKKAEDVKKVV